MGRAMSQSSGVFKGIFTVIASIVGAVGALIIFLSLGGGFAPTWNAGEAIVTDGLILGALFVVMGVGFFAFGVMIGKEGWDAVDA